MSVSPSDVALQRGLDLLAVIHLRFTRLVTWKTNQKSWGNWWTFISWDPWNCTNYQLMYRVPYQTCINELSMNCELYIFTILEPESELQTQICSLCLRASFSLKDSNTQFTCDQHQNHSKSAALTKVPPSLTIHLGFAPASHAEINHTTYKIFHWPQTHSNQHQSTSSLGWKIWNSKKIRFIPDSAPKISKETNIWIAVIFLGPLPEQNSPNSSHFIPYPPQL